MKTYCRDWQARINIIVRFGWEHPQNKVGEHTNVWCG